ncbi:UDP-N-acetylmuramate--L-alanine ligase [Candidatus Desantisbacteria bacterium]|nr:UDP-N-acetylmuramate--L-alanine ligase [Candidatus Desantisbacteria bacterium]
MFKKVKHIHMVGIGGSGMNGIAEVLINLGYKVTGSDMKKTKITLRLEELGAEIIYEHKPENISNADVVVISTAINTENPELKEAVEKKIPIIPRAEMLAEIMRMKYAVTIAGSHGKTTTTSLIASILANANMDPLVVNGGILNSLNSSVRMGKGELVVAEADESDGSFLLLSPTLTVITNIDKEHLDYYKTMDALREAYIKFVNKIPFYGCAALCLDDENIQSIIPHIKKKYFTYGLKTQADIKASNIQFKATKSEYEITAFGKNLGKVVLNVPGIHNICNSMAAFGIGLELGIEPEVIKQGLMEYSGVRRRFHIKGEFGGIMVVDDYGHHPSEIQATLNAARTGWNRRLIVIFQLHRYSRTLLLEEEFKRSFYQADILIITEIYPAGEKPIPGVSALNIAEGVKKHGHKNVLFVPDKAKIIETLLPLLKKDDIVITLGAGDVTYISDELVEKLKIKYPC